MRRPSTAAMRVAGLVAGWGVWSAYLVFGSVGGWSPDPLALAVVALPLLVTTGRWTHPAVSAVATAGTTLALSVPSYIALLGDLPWVVRVGAPFVGFATASLAGTLFRQMALARPDLDHVDDLRAASAELRHILESVPVGIVVLDGDAVRHHNGTALRMLACTPAGLAARVADLPPRPVPAAPAEHDGTTTGTTTVETPRGPRTLQVAATEMDGMRVLVFTDLTDVRRQNEVLRRQREELAIQRARWEGLMEHVGHCYFRVEEGRPPEFSRSAPAVLSVAADALREDPWCWVREVHGRDRRRVRAALAAAREGQAGHIEFLAGHAGSAHWLRMTLRPVVQEAAVVAIEVHGQDITSEVAYRIQAEALRRKEEKLHQLQEMDAFKTHFMHTIAHELSTPLTPLKMQVDLLAEIADDHADDEQRDGFRLVQRNIDRLEALVKDMLDASRIQTGRLPIDPRPMDLAAVVRDVCTSFHAQARSAGLALEVEAPDSVPIDGDDARVAQVLTNLLSNALKFTPSGGTVRVDLHAGEDIVLRVQDTGFGLGLHEQGQLFVPFNQFHRDLVGAHVGTGMGLYICKAIVEGHGGTIECHSDGVGTGATFTVRLPRPAPGQEERSLERPPRHTAPNRLSTPLESAAVRGGRPGP